MTARVCACCGREERRPDRETCDCGASRTVVVNKPRPLKIAARGEKE